MHRRRGFWDHRPLNPDGRALRQGGELEASRKRRCGEIRRREKVEEQCVKVQTFVKTACFTLLNVLTRRSRRRLVFRRCSLPFCENRRDFTYGDPSRCENRNGLPN